MGQVKYDHMFRFAALRVVADFVALLLLVLRPENGAAPTCCPCSDGLSCRFILLRVNGQCVHLLAGFVFNTDLWVWKAIRWVLFSNPLTSDVGVKACLLLIWRPCQCSGAA